MRQTAGLTESSSFDHRQRVVGRQIINSSVQKQAEDSKSMGLACDREILRDRYAETGGG